MCAEIVSRSTARNEKEAIWLSLPAKRSNLVIKNKRDNLALTTVMAACDKKDCLFAITVHPSQQV
jgi:hypothetical protein